MDAFDADVLIYAAVTDHPLGHRVAALVLADAAGPRVGSLLLLPELLTKPTRQGRPQEVESLLFLLARLDLRPVDVATATLAVALGSRYGLAAIDALHLATAVRAGADRFVTNNRRDFDAGRIDEIDVTFPADLP